MYVKEKKYREAFTIRDAVEVLAKPGCVGFALPRPTGDQRALHTLTRAHGDTRQAFLCLHSVLRQNKMLSVFSPQAHPRAMHTTVFFLYIHKTARNPETPITLRR